MWKLAVTVVCLFQLKIHLIDCADSYSGISRRRRSFENVSFNRHGRACHDFCAMNPNLCRNNGTCVTDKRTCIGKCVCAPGWEGKWCKDKNEPKTTASSNKTRNATRDMEDFTTRNETKPSPIHPVHVAVATSTHPIIKPTNSLGRNTVDIVDKQEAERTFQMLNVETSDTNGDEQTERETCLKHCTNGDCIKVKDIYKCKKQVNATDSKVIKKCDPGFECINGVCDLAEREKKSYKCICEQNYVGQFCDEKCPLDCGKHGYCDIHGADNTYKCYCQWNYTGVNCSQLVPQDPEPPIPEEVTFHWYVVAVSVASVITTVGVMVMLAYMMWRRRLVFMLKIVHYFQQYEDDDGKEFDAFVSYKSCPRDEEFVLHQLYPKLEREFKFKLCMHFRDFLPGEAIANNIVKAIESSRRTIIVLSPEYVKSEWCRMEYQKAQHEMLKLKHKIIPVVLEDLSEVQNVDKNLKSILSSVTYLEWPGSENTKTVDRFWKKLELSLPKKTSQLTSPSAASDSSSFSHPVTNSGITSSESVPSHCISSQIKPVSNSRSKSDSPTPSSLTTDSNSPKFLKGKRKDFRHFMGKLVRSKIFGRQDSNSSQTALVDEETIGSRSICGSVSESMLSESSESLCSASDIPPIYLNEIREDLETNRFIRVYTKQNISKPYSYDGICKQESDPRERVSVNVNVNKIDKESRVTECEKDHCEGTECEMCAKSRSLHISPDIVDKRFHLGESVPGNEDIECEYCTYMRCKSDNNRVHISAVNGNHKLKIQKLPYDIPDCLCCNNLLEGSIPYRGSMKERKDAKNVRIMNEKRLRVGSLPRNYKGSKVHAKQDNNTNREHHFKTGNTQCDQTSASYVNEGYVIDVCENV